METRSELKAKYPEYDNMRAIDKMLLEDSHNTKASKFRKNFERPLEVILGIGLPVGLYFLAKEGYAAPDQGFAIYGVSALTGVITGKLIGMALGGLIYETFAKEGDINQTYQKIKKNFNNSSL